MVLKLFIEIEPAGRKRSKPTGCLVMVLPAFYGMTYYILIGIYITELDISFYTYKIVEANLMQNGVQFCLLLP